MKNIETVLGQIDTSQLGFTLSHEHVVASSAGIPQIYPEFIQRENSIIQSIEILKKVKSDGVDTIVDLTTIDLNYNYFLFDGVLLLLIALQCLIHQ